MKHHGRRADACPIFMAGIGSFKMRKEGSEVFEKP
jgi:hypothetical protein